ncbi:protease complex subunit PrcB family protein [Chryseobacterium camelliae]|uniref:Protease complex subunit PrcB family protein n=1 Tax=Chryseobacterium camelliae TaxID=1265445 RepID=A0ABY7QNX2_9FLAO|nr:protease complex subunit PrcB family protein [Chryseobacterium camelliae]WBV61382.1 protease complex subunit PrcB family protein [Chryseobacterium camelliae]
MKKILLLTVAISALFIMSCQENEENSTASIPINSQLIGKGSISSHSMPQQNIAITNTTQWNTFLTALDSTYNVSGSFTEINIDFNQYMLIVAFDQVYNNGGHSIDIVAIDESSQSINVDVEKLLQGNTTSVITQPYHIVKIPKIAKPIVFY